MKRGLRLDQINRHLLILDGHNSYVILEVVKISMEVGLDIVSIPSHTSHALQPLDVACFAPFKIAFWKYRDLWSMRNKNGTVGKQELCEWTSKALHNALTLHIIKSSFQKIGIWPLDCMVATRAMTTSQGFKDPDWDQTESGQGGRPTGSTDHLGHVTMSAGGGRSIPV